MDILEAVGAAHRHGFLPQLLHKCVNTLCEHGEDALPERLSRRYVLGVFSLVQNIASYVHRTPSTAPHHPPPLSATIDAAASNVTYVNDLVSTCCLSLAGLVDQDRLMSHSSHHI